MRKRILSILLAAIMIVTMLPSMVFAEEEEAVIGDVGYGKFADAVAAANEGQTVEIVKNFNGTIPNIDKNITIKAADGVEVVFDCKGSGSICSIPNGCTFENVTMNFGTSNYHGFQHAGTINMNNCTLNGLFFSYGNMNFTGCTFNAPGTEYSMWLYAGDISFDSCVFNGAGKFFNAYNERNGAWKISVENCVAVNEGKANKAVFNVKETCGAKNLQYDVTLKGANVAVGNFKAASTGDALDILNAFVQVDDKRSGGTEDGGDIVIKTGKDKGGNEPKVVEVTADTYDNKELLAQAIADAKKLDANLYATPSTKAPDTVYFEITEADVKSVFHDDASAHSDLIGKYYFASIKEAADFIQQVKDSMGMSDAKLDITIRMLDNAYPADLYPQAWVKDLDASSYIVDDDPMACAFAFNAFNYTNGDKELIDKVFEKLSIKGSSLLDFLFGADLNDVNISDTELENAMNEAGFTDAEKQRVAEILQEVSEYFFWNCDFVITFDQGIGDGEVYIAGQYDLHDSDWLAVTDSLNANEPLRLLGSKISAFPYQAILLLETFNCGVVKNWAPSAVGKTMKVELRMYETARDNNEEGGNYGLRYETGTSVVMATYNYTISEVDVAEVDKEAIAEKAIEEISEDVTPEQKKVVEDVVSTITSNTEVVKVETKVAEAVKEDAISSIIAKAVEKGGDSFLTGKHTDTKIEVKLESIKVDTQTVVSAQTSTEITVNSAKYDVKPIATVTTTVTTGEGTEAVTKTITETVELTDEDLNDKPITVRLAVAPTNAKVAKITHTSDKHPTEEFYAEIQGTGENQYVEIQMTHFSEVEVETLAKTSATSRLMGHQERSNDSSVGRFIIPITETELNKLGDKIVIVGGDDKTTELTFEVDCVYTYFNNKGEMVAAEGMGYKAFIIVEKDIHGNSFSGYGYYKFYNKNISDDDSTLLFDAAFFKKTNG